MRLSASDIGDYLACRLRWHYQSPNQRWLRPIVEMERAPLRLGTAVHIALDAFYSGETSDPANVLLEWFANSSEYPLRPDEQELAHLGAVMLRGYVREYGQPSEDISGIRFLVSEQDGSLACEQQFQISIPDTEDGWLVGTLDGIVVTPEGQYWIVDHKTARSFPREETLVLNRQFLAYTYAAQRLSNGGQLERYGVPIGVKIEGVLYNGLRKQIPGPRVTQPLFQRHWIAHTFREVVGFQNFLNQLYEEWSRPDLAMFANPGWQCEDCAFKSPCIARQMGEDEEYLLATGYTQGKSRGAVYEDE